MKKVIVMAIALACGFWSMQSFAGGNGRDSAVTEYDIRNHAPNTGMQQRAPARSEKRSLPYDIAEGRVTRCNDNPRKWCDVDNNPPAREVTSPSPQQASGSTCGSLSGASRVACEQAGKLGGAFFGR